MCNTGAKDTVFHRAWECQCSEVVQARVAHADQSLIAEALQAGPDSAMFTRGLMIHPVYSFPTLQPQQVVFHRLGQKVEDPSAWTMQGSIYYDGTCDRQAASDLNRAAFAVVEVDSEARVVATLQATVPSSLPQT
eukprot:7861224-Karenia_brevis.AAC.1